MNGNLLGIWIFFTEIFLAFAHVSTFRFCNSRTFKELPHVDSIKCSEPSYCEHKNVFGWRTYHEDSVICAAAAHAGYFVQNEAEVRFKRVEFKEPFESVMQNRLTSKRKPAATHGYVFTSGLDIPKKAKAIDVYATYSTKNGLTVHCFRGSEPPQRFHSYNHKPIYSPMSVTRTNRVLSFSLSRARKGNRRALICPGKYPMQDVFMAFRHNDDDCESKKSIYFLHKNEKFSLDYSKCNSETPDTAFVAKLPITDGRTRMKLPLAAGSQNISLPGLYSVTSTMVVTDNVKTPYFFLITTETSKDKYGAFRNETCPKCKNGGVCHPLLGSCMCKPGYGGSKCGKVCPFDMFGPKCQQSCFETSSKPCQWVQICQPPPIGCSCARGYSGKQCHELEVFSRPHLRNKPKITFSSNGNATFRVKICSKSQKPCFSNLKGETVSYVTVRIKKTSWQFPVTEDYTTPEIVFDGEAEQKISIILDTDISLNQSDRYGKDLKNKEKQFFIYPCKGKTTRNLAQSTLGIDLSLEASNDDIPFSCSVRLSRNEMHWNLTGQYDRISYTNRHQFGSLPSGSKFQFRSTCWNEFGKCPWTEPQEIFTYPDPSELVTYSNEEIQIEEFDLLRDDRLSITLYDVSEDRIHEWKQLTSCSVIGQKFSPIISAQNISLVNSSTTGVKTRNLKKYVAEKMNAFYIGVLMKYVDQQKEEICWKTEFVTSSYLFSLIGMSLGVAVLIFVILLICVISIGSKSGRTHRLIKGYFRGVDRNKDGRLRKRNRGELLESNSSNRKTKLERKNTNSIRSVEETVHSFRDDDYKIECQVASMVNSIPIASKFVEIPKMYNHLTTDIGMAPENRRKNRYKNNLPYDHTRVILTPVPGKAHSDYINASHIKGYKPNKKYIACQGPKDENVSTMEDFWRMVLETGSVAILMIANFVENRKKKVGKYFSRTHLVEFGSISVSPISIQEMTHYILTRLSIMSNQKSMEIDHYQFTEWPDHGVLEDATTVAQMLDEMNNMHPQGTVIVHCSAGIGRTGTSLLALLMNDYRESTGKVDAIEVVDHLRRSRPNLIENSVQFNFALKVFDDLLYSNKGALTEENAEEFISSIEHQDILFNQAISLPISMTFKKGNNPATRGNNRNPAILPADHAIAKFDAYGYDFYINAISVPLRNIKDYLIITEYPFKYTLEEFWLTVLLKQCNFLVLLNETPLDEYHPELLIGGFSAKHGQIQVDIEPVKDTDFARSFIVTLSTEYLQHQCEAWQLLGWTEKDLVPSNRNCVMTLADIILGNSIDNGSTILCCEDGVTACGLMTAALMLLDNWRTHQILNVYRTVVKVRRYRPEFLNTREQYDLLLEIALECLNQETNDDQLE